MAIVGGPDVDARLDLMRQLSTAYDVFAVGSDASLARTFQANHFHYVSYRLAPSTNVAADALALVQLFCLLRRERPAIVHAFDTKPCVLARLAARLAGVPIIIGTMPGLGRLYVEDMSPSWQRSGVRLLYEQFQRLSCSVSDITTVQNPDDAADVLRRKLVAARNLRIIPGSGVDLSRFDRDGIHAADILRLRSELDIPRHSIVVLMVSRVFKAKGVCEYAEAARVVRAVRPDVRFLLVGPLDRGGDEALSPLDVDRISQHVQWIGARSDTALLYALSDVAVLPSYYREGMPRVLLEAGAMGLPLIATDMPGCRDVVTHGVNGLLVPARDSAALAAAIADLIQDPARRAAFGLASRKLIREKFSVESIGREVQGMYASLLEESQRRA